MNKTELESYKKKLLDLRARLRGNVNSMLDVAFSKTGGEVGSNSGDAADVGSEDYDRSLTLSITQGEEETLKLIDAALLRIENGTYGTCLGSGAKISKQRLNAIPYTPYCVEYASRQETP